MKTTSYEISKKLKEAGFEAEADYYFYGQQLRNSAFPSHSTDADRKVHVKSYDLETLLDALPDSITKEYKSKEDGEIKEFKERLAQWVLLSLTVGVHRRDQQRWPQCKARGSRRPTCPELSFAAVSS